MLKSLQRIIREARSCGELSVALQVIVDRVGESLEADACSIFLTNDASGEYVLTATYGLNNKFVGKTRFKYGEGLIGVVGEREEPLNIDLANAHPNYVNFPQLNELGLKAFLALPITYKSKLLGVIVVQQKVQRFFSSDEEATLTTLLVQLAPIIHSLRLHGGLGLEKNKRLKSNTCVAGVAAAPGVTIGRILVIYPPADLDAVPDRVAQDLEQEIIIFETALVQAREEMQALQVKAKSSLSVAEHALFDAYARILDSRTLVQEVIDEIKTGLWAQAALKRVFNRHILQFEALEDHYLQERASDFRDLGRRILACMQHQGRHEELKYPKKTVLLSDELTATAMFEVPDGQLCAVVSASGSANSHVAILARAMGIPAVMGLHGIPLSKLENKEVIVDGYNGLLYLSPSPNIKKEFKILAEEEQRLDSELFQLRDLPAVTQDGHNVSLYVNTGLASDAGLSFSMGAEGVGLYRTETPFMLRDRFPNEEEQRIMYRQLLSTFAPRPVVMRTLDIGGDKQLTYFPFEEENPFLGWRGIRITLDHPELMLQQVRAMLAANVEVGNLQVLLPMITSVSEVEAALRLIQQALRELKGENKNVLMPPMGIMLEVPGAIYQAEELARRVDFVSVGSNDLIQYLLAVDRNNAKVVERYDSFHPAVLRALKQAVDATHKVNKPISICGEMASDPLSVVLLLAMGFDSLSMNARSLPRVKWVIRNVTLKLAKKLLRDVLKMDDSREIRNHMELSFEELGLSALIRAGN